jgi:hypothetical protein
MPIYEIEQYEVYATTYLVEADDEAKAVEKLFTDKSPRTGQEFVEICEDLGLPVENYQELAEKLQDSGFIVDEAFIPSIKSITKIKE